MRNFAGIGLFAAALLAAAQTRADMTLGPGETLTWATDAPASGEAITATGGTIVFDANATVAHNFYLGGEVSVVINNGATVRFTKTFYQTDPSRTRSSRRTPSRSRRTQPTPTSTWWGTSRFSSCRRNGAARSRTRSPRTCCSAFTAATW